MTPAASRLESLENARSAFAALPAERLAAAWSDAIAELRYPAPGSKAAELRERMATALGFSGKGLDAGLDLVLDSVAGDDALALFATEQRGGPGPLLTILASTPPGLAAQAILPALALRRPLLLKTASAEPAFAPFLVARLAAREPLLGEVLATASWRGGDRAVEDPLFAAAGHVVAYGGRAAMAAIAPRCASFFGFGPKISLAIVGADADPAAIAPGLARDVALFDQRGCLSVQLVLKAGDASALAAALAKALETIAAELPPGPAGPQALAALRLEREAAALRGLEMPPLPLRLGTVIVEEQGAALRPSPGGRTVLIYPVADLEQAIARLVPWQNLLQGAALAGEAARLAPALAALGVTRIAPPGELQHAGIASWPNGGRPALEIFAARAAVRK